MKPENTNLSSYNHSRTLNLGTEERCGDGIYPSLVDALRLFDGWWCRLTSLFPLSTTIKSIVILLNVDQKTLPSHGLKILKMS